jgi:hypothetical protein
LTVQAKYLLKKELTTELTEKTVYSSYPFGMPMPNRTYSLSSSKYRFGFNGQEKDDEVYGAGNLNTAEFWEYDTRIGRRWNTDPRPNISVSSYATFNNNPISFSDVHGDTTIYHGMNGNYLNTINDNGATTMIKVDEKAYNTFNKTLNKNGIKLSPDAYVSSLNNILDKLEATGKYGDLISRQVGSELVFSGQMENSSNIIPQGSIDRGKAKPLYANGTLTVSALFDNGSRISGDLSARSGPWDYSALPNGDYDASSIVNTQESGMVRNGIGFKVIFNDNTVFNRTQLRIHPDQEPSAGSAGCIGLTVTRAELVSFRNYMRYALRNGTVPLRVNIRNNPNYSRPKGKNSTSGE